MPTMLPMMPSFSMVGVSAGGAGSRHRDADAGVDDVVLVDQDVGIDDVRRRSAFGIDRSARRVADQAGWRSRSRRSRCSAR